jgi:acetyltransferase-like isoleucine patch superfamily enzyme
VTVGRNVVIKENCIIEDHVTIGDGVWIDSNTILRQDVTIGSNSWIGANCIIGEYQMDFIAKRVQCKHELQIGERATIRSGSILYSGSCIGDDFQTGHHVTIRENNKIGNGVSIGTFSDIQNQCEVGDYVRIHSSVFIPKLTRIEDCVWIFPRVVFTNDPTPPSDTEKGCHIHSFAIIAANAVLLPGIEVHHDAVVGAGAVVTKDVKECELVIGNPAKVAGDVRDIKNRTTGDSHYPWRYHFDRAMPWCGFGFEKWYQELEDTKKELLFGRR